MWGFLPQNRLCQLCAVVFLHDLHRIPERCTVTVYLGSILRQHDLCMHYALLVGVVMRLAIIATVELLDSTVGSSGNGALPGAAFA